MSVRLGRYVFRMIRGRIVPIRIGAEAKTLAGGGVSSKAAKQLKLLQERAGAKVSKGGKLSLPAKSIGGTEGMNKFIDKTGAMRFSYHPDRMGDPAHVNLDFVRKPSKEQMDKLKEIISNRDHVFVDRTTIKGDVGESGQFKGIWNAIRSGIFGRAPDIKRAKNGLPPKAHRALKKQAIKDYGLTEDPREAGFIFRRGGMLDLSGKRQGGEPFTRALDHREVARYERFRRLPPTSKNVTKALKEAKMSRKAQSVIKHAITNTKNDIEKLKDYPDIQKGYVERLNNLLKARRAKRKG